jgi:sugar phosphate isomerase/epimerase
MVPANPISLHHLTVLDASPAELVSIASSLSCDHVCLFTYVPAAAGDAFPRVGDSETCAAVIARCDETGVSVHNIEYFGVHEDIDLELYRPGLERGRRLGARRATAHIHDPVRDRGIETFAALCDLAADYGLDVGLEFTVLSAIRTVQDAAATIEAAGRANADIVVDALHLVRCGGTVADLASIDPRMIGYVQVCDGPATMPADQHLAEAIGERRVPGTGEFPLQAFVAAVPPGPVIAVEVPLSAWMRRGAGPLERAGCAVAATRALLARRVVPVS